MRAALVLALAPYIGQTLTSQLADAIVAQFPPDGAPIDLSQFAPQACGSLVFAAERGADILPELHALHEAHWSETEGYQQPMNPDYARGIALEQQGRMLQLTARAGGALVGNIRMYLARSMHTQRLIAEEDTVYIVPAYRGGRSALRFIQYMEAAMRQLGVSLIFMDDKIANPAAGRLLEALGYTHVANRRYKNLEGK